MQNDELRKLPGVDKLLLEPSTLLLKEQFGIELITYAARIVLEKARENIFHGANAESIEQLSAQIKKEVEKIDGKTLKPVINATGIIIHTNLGRAPLGKEIFHEIEPVLSWYSNLEFDLQAGKRGQRTDHISGLLKFITGAEDILIVNNNAAAIYLILKTLSEKKEVIVSRGELIEIGGSFRIPEIMKASGARMVEVGTTNRTRSSDYENAITKNTRLIFKAHKSNYYIGGFTEEVELIELSGLAKKHNLILVFDSGSGLLKRPVFSKHLEEPNVRQSISSGADLVTFSCDKLIGATQAGIIAGKKDLIKILAKVPLMRALRVDKFTIAVLFTILNFYLREEVLIKKCPVFAMLNRKKTELLILAEKIFKGLKSYQIKAEIVESIAQCGGGALPQLELESYSVKILPDKADKKFASKLFKKLLAVDTPVLGVLKEGDFFLDVFTIRDEEVDAIVQSVSICIQD
ncbi:MAG: L-seryl-tRNA(Sec) selenium transferase [Ignavibacteriales bacterium]|nr:L-seryl-tRNA(Sec) selenium transferase [Ignavibacteriales bacterium]